MRKTHNRRNKRIAVITSEETQRGVLPRHGQALCLPTASMTHGNLVHKFIRVPQAMKISDPKAAVDKEWEKLEKISAWNLTKVKSKKEVIDEARMSGATVHFASLMDICHLKNDELEAKHQKYKGRVVLRGDIVKDNSGSYAVFTEQGSSASQMTAAKIMDIISRLSGCDGQAADAVSAYTQVKMEDVPSLFGRSWRQLRPVSGEKSRVRRRLFWKHKERKGKSNLPL